MGAFDRGLGKNCLSSQAETLSLDFLPAAVSKAIALPQAHWPCVLCGLIENGAALMEQAVPGSSGSLCPTPSAHQRRTCSGGRVLPQWLSLGDTQPPAAAIPQLLLKGSARILIPEARA